MAGRRPKPTELKLLEGNPGHRPLNLHEPKPLKGIPASPIGLNAEGQATYALLAVQLDALGVLTNADGSALELLADACLCAVLRRDLGSGGRHPRAVQSQLRTVPPPPSIPCSCPSHV